VGRRGPDSRGSGLGPVVGVINSTQNFFLPSLFHIFLGHNEVHISLAKSMASSLNTGVVEGLSNFWKLC